MRAHGLLAHVLRQMRESGENSVIICFVQPPENNRVNKRLKKRKSTHSQVNTEVFEDSKACANKESLAKNEVPIPNSGSDLEWDVF